MPAACSFTLPISTPNSNAAAAAKKSKNVSDWTQTIKNAIEAASNEDEWAYLSVVGNHVRALEPAFDPRSFGHKKLSDLIKSRPDLFQFRAHKKLAKVRLAP